jgi:hypothetical protein
LPCPRISATGYDDKVRASAARAGGHLHAALPFAAGIADFEVWGFRRQEAGLRDHRLHLDRGQAERNHHLGMRVNDRHDIRARLVDLAMNVTLAVDAPALGIDRLAVGHPELQQVIKRHQGRRHGARHEEDVRVLCRAHRDVTEAVENGLVHQDPVRGDEICLSPGIRIAACRLRAGKRARDGQDRNADQEPS